jgi:hypothetical protein
VWRQLTVKLAVGPVFALLGVMIMQSGLLDQLRPFEGFGIATLVWATIFGGSQQFLTGLIDRRASDLMVETGSPPAARTVHTLGRLRPWTARQPRPARRAAFTAPGSVPAPPSG